MKRYRRNVNLGTPFSHSDFLGPSSEERSCTDKAFIIVICAAWVGWISLCIYVIINAEPTIRLLDWQAETCGEKKSYKHEIKTYLDNSNFTKNGNYSIESDTSRRSYQQLCDGLKRNWLWFVGSAVAACILAVMTVILLRIYPYKAMWAGLILTAILLVAGIVLVNNIGIIIVFGILLTFVITVAVLLIMRRSKVDAAIVIIEEASKSVTEMPLTILFGFINFLLKCVIVIWFMYIYVKLLESGKPIFTAQGLNETTCVCALQYKNLTCNDRCDPKLFKELCRSPAGGPCTIAHCAFTALEPKPAMWLYLFIHVFISFWTYLFFTTALFTLILGGAFAEWYWNKDKSHPPFLTKFSTQRAIRYHIGTAAFGSLLLAILKIIASIIKVLTREEEEEEEDRPVVGCCCRCCCAIFSKILEWVNEQAYIMCAIHGKNFCTSTKGAVQLLLRNVTTVVIGNTIAEGILHIAKLLIVIVILTIVYCVALRDELAMTAITIIMLLLMLILFLTGIIFQVLKIAVDTMFLCVLEDIERNEEPQFASDKLKEALLK